MNSIKFFSMYRYLVDIKKIPVTVAQGVMEDLEFELENHFKGAKPYDILENLIEGISKK